MSGIVQNNILRSSGTVAVSAAGLNWNSTIITGSTATVEAGNGYWINTTSNTCTITLPSSAEAGDQIVLIDFLRTWGTNKIIIDSNGLNYQGNPDTYTVEYTTSGQSLNIVYSDATKGWIPLDDDVAALEPVAPAIQRGIFAFGYAGGVVNTKNLVSSSGVVSADATGVGTARYSMGASTYGGDKAIFAFGNVSGTATNLSNLVNNSGVVGNDVTGVGTARANFDATGYGGDKAIFAYGNTLGGDNYVSMSNLVSNQGVVATDVTGVGLAREELAACSFGDGNAIFGYGMNNTASDYQNITNKVNSSGVVASNTTGVGTARKDLIAANYSDGTVGMFIFGEAGLYKSIRNLVNNLGVVASDTSVTGTDAGTGSTQYGGDKAIIAFGRTASGGAGLTNGRILISNTGSVAGIVSGAGTARNGLRAAGYSYSA